MLDEKWRKSSKSGPYTDNCVEVRLINDIVEVRNSRRPQEAVVSFDTAEWQAFVSGVAEGELNVR